MTDKEYCQQKRRILKVAGKWLEILGLLWWDVKLEYHREGLETSEENESENWGAVARVSVKWEYNQAQICFDMPMVASLTDAELDSHFRHECAHILVNEMREWKDDHDPVLHEERVVTGLTKAFGWIWDAGEKEGEKQAIKNLQGAR